MAHPDIPYFFAPIGPIEILALAPALVVHSQGHPVFRTPTFPGHNFYALLMNDALLVVKEPMSGLQRKNLTAAFGARAGLGAGARASAHKTSTEEPDESKK